MASHSQFKIVIYIVGKYSLGERASELWRHGNSEKVSYEKKIRMKAARLECSDYKCDRSSVMYVRESAVIFFHPQTANVESDGLSQTEVVLCLLSFLLTSYSVGP